jgi:NAD(P)H dehydrogenase (quinone)
MTALIPMPTIESSPGQEQRIDEADVPMIGGPDGVIRGPAGNGRFSGVALDDVARVARAVLLSPEEHVGHTYDLTGPEELSLAEAAAIVTEVTGQRTYYVEETPEEAFASRAS